MAQKSNKRNKKNKKSSGFAWACWLLVLILVLLIFLVKKDTIITNLKNTSFFDRVFGTTPEFVEKHEAKEKKSKKKDNSNDEKLEEEVITLNIPSKNSKKLTMDDLKNNQTSETIVEKTPEKSEKVTDEKQENKTARTEETTGDKAVNESPKVSEKTPESKKEEKPAPAPVVRKTDLNLCFVLIDSEGHVSRKEIKRSVNKSDSPLTEAINQLLLGPLPGNSAEKDCRSLIPDGTKLLSAKVSNGVAYLNFNDSFEFNIYGVEGYKHQLEQIVFTATAFSTVKSVQFLIDGEKEDYLGSEGMWIGSPLSRSSF